MLVKNFKSHMSIQYVTKVEHDYIGQLMQFLCIFMLNAVDIGNVTITSESSVPDTGTAGKMFTLNCSVDILPIPLSEDVPSPSFEWFYGPTNTSLPSGVTVSNVTKSGNIHISALHFFPLQLSHAEMYTCRFGSNERLAANTMVTVNGKLLGIFLLKFITYI